MFIYGSINKGGLYVLNTSAQMEKNKNDSGKARNNPFSTRHNDRKNETMVISLERVRYIQRTILLKRFPLL